MTDTLKVLADKYAIKFHIINNSADGFSIYDDCDLHIGFRVHAHIYNLSRRNYSILVSEDIRGAGVNQTLGLENIGVVKTMHISKKKIWRNYGVYHQYGSLSDSNNLAKRISDYMDFTELVGYKNYIEAIKWMQYYFEKMKQHFELINAVIGE